MLNLSRYAASLRCYWFNDNDRRREGDVDEIDDFDEVEKFRFALASGLSWTTSIFL